MKYHVGLEHMIKVDDNNVTSWHDNDQKKKKKTWASLILVVGKEMLTWDFVP